MDALLQALPAAFAMGLLGAIVFSGIGLISGTDETTTIAPLTLLVALLGVPPAGVFTFFLAGAVAKHITHAIPTALLGIPGDTMAAPLLQQATLLRALGVPHIALLLDLVMRTAVKIGDPRMHVEHRAHRVQEVFARLFLVRHEGLRQHAFVLELRACGAHGFRVLHLVQAVDAGLDRHPLQQMGQPARRDRGKLGDGLGSVR